MYLLFWRYLAVRKEEIAPLMQSLYAGMAQIYSSPLGSEYSMQTLSSKCIRVLHSLKT